MQYMLIPLIRKEKESFVVGPPGTMMPRATAMRADPHPSKYNSGPANLLSILTLSDESRVDGVTCDNILFLDKR